MRRLPALLGLLALLLAAGCGGDDSDSAEGDAPAAEKTEKAPPPAPTKAEYIAELDAACDKTTKASVQLLRDLGKSVKAENAALQAGGSIAAALKEQSKLYGQVVEVRNELTSELEAIEPPKAGGADAYFATRAAATEATENLSTTLAKSADLPTQEALKAQTAASKRTTATSRRARKAAKAYGLKDCERQVKIG